jgi:four helix bundle protein
MVVTRFQDFAAWQLSRELERRVFAFTAISPANRDLDFCRQARKSSSSPARNIAEGCKELITLGNRALGASTRLAQYLDEAAKTWASKRGQFRKPRKNPEPEEPEP